MKNTTKLLLAALVLFSGVAATYLTGLQQSTSVRGEDRLLLVTNEFLGNQRYITASNFLEGLKVLQNWPTNSSATNVSSLRFSDPENGGYFITLYYSNRMFYYRDDRLSFSPWQYASGSSYFLTNVLLGLPNLSTTATDGFLGLPSMSGQPTGIPTAFGDYVPAVVDTATMSLWLFGPEGWTQMSGGGGASAWDELSTNALTAKLDSNAWQTAWIGRTNLVNLWVTNAMVQVPKTLTYDGTNFATDAAAGNQFRLTLTQNSMLLSPTNSQDGQRITWELIQDSAGVHTLLFGSAFKFGSDVPVAVLTTNANKRDFLTALCDGSNWYVVGFIRGF